MKNIKWLFIFTFLLSNEVIAQGKVNLLGGFDFSEDWYRYARHKDVLRATENKLRFILINLNTSLQYKPSKLYSVELGIQEIQFFNLCVDTAYLTRHPENRASLFIGTHPHHTSLSFSKFYTSYYLTGTRYLPLSERFSFYALTGLSWNQINKRTSADGVNTFYDSKNNETLQLTYACAHNYVGIIGELGVNMVFFKGKIQLYNGLRLNKGFKKVLSANYTDIQNGNIINTDHISTRGTYMGVVWRIGINLFSGRSSHLSRKNKKQPSEKKIKFIKVKSPRYNFDE
jgi:hypothetical protein